jgi:hypothetical protein
VLFRAEPRKPSLRYELDGRSLARADREYFWAPQPGAHLLRLLDEQGTEQDRVAFSVRGAPPPPALSPKE